ncbi:hypothetical protein ABKN59_009554 [Abortiporus biennis]
MFSSLPSDIVLHILVLSPVSDISIFHSLAVSHRFVRLGTSLEHAAKSIDGILESGSGGHTKTSSWKELYRKWLTIQRNWSGKGSVRRSEITFLDAGRDQNVEVQTFKLVDDDQTLLCMTEDRGLIVYALEDFHILFQMDVGLRRFIDYSGGFLIFSVKGNIEIWRRSTDCELESSISTPLQSPSPFAVQDTQLKAIEEIRKQYPSQSGSSQHLRGQYQPHGLIQVYHPRLYRFSFPTLAIIKREDRIVNLINVVKGTERVIHVDELTTIRGTNLVVPHGALMDMTMTPDYVCICYDTCIVLFTHEEHDQAQQYPSLVITEPLFPHVLQKTSPRMRPSSTNLDNISGTALTEITGCYTANDTFQRYIIVDPDEKEASEAQQTLIRPDWGRPSTAFITAQISPDGQHIIAITGHSLLYLIPNYRRIALEYVTLQEVVQRIYLPGVPGNIIWESQQNSHSVLLYVEDYKLFLLDLDPHYHDPDSISSSSSPSSSLDYKATISLHNASTNCIRLVQPARNPTMAMTPTRIYLHMFEAIGSIEYDEEGNPLPRHDLRRTMSYIDFTAGCNI